MYENLTYNEFQALPQDEQSQLLKLREQRVIEAPTLYEWDIRVATVYSWGWLTIIIPCGVMTLIGYWIGGEMLYISLGVVIFFAPQMRYLWSADKQYHYRLTTEGLVTTEHDAIPDAAYAVVRGIAWFGIVVCVVSVALLGPAALVGAGGFALMAFFFTDFKNEETTSTTDIKPGYPHLIKLSHKRPYIDCEAEKFYFGFYSNVSCYCHPEDMHKIISLLMEQLPGSELILFKNDLAVRNSDMLSRDGELVQLSDFEPKNK
ncbi:hypothetical protein ACJW8B_14225 [Plesiomonas shigelloides]|uniref:hypothetical protein n=1 Tax=Plesiomonas shigelloides TaxID=703 RepID=UPI00387F29F6